MSNLLSSSRDARGLHRPERRRRAFTVVETMISLVISGMITGIVVYLMVQSSRTTKDLYAETRTRSARMAALDQVRYRLIEARIGTLDITDANHRIRFIDPNLDTTSEFYFDTETSRLLYDDDIDDNKAPVVVVSGPIDLTFEHEGGDPMDSIVLLNVRTAAPIGQGDVDTQDGETVVFLRNV